jgi:hypothetical protein
LEFPEWDQDFWVADFFTDPGETLEFPECGQDFYNQPEISEQVT